MNDTPLPEAAAVESVLARWPRCRELVDEAVDAVHAELMTDGLDTDAAYALAHVVLLRRIFFWLTVIGARHQVLNGDSDSDGVMEWIASEYEDWAYGDTVSDEVEGSA